MSTPQPSPANPAILSAQDGYDLWASIYDDEDNPLVALETRQLGPQLANVRGLDVADIGCGTGRIALALAAAGARVTALDFSEAMLEKARQKPGAAAVTFIRHDLETTPLPLAPTACDLVTCCLVLDHIANLAGLFGEMQRICRPTGRIHVSIMHPAMMLRGIQARFTDPTTGREVRPASVANQISDYVMAATRAGLVFDEMSEHAVDEALAARCPRAQKYLGWPLLLLMRLRPM
jgi:malonyl-CoA O-methyltransferase